MAPLLFQALSQRLQPSKPLEAPSLVVTSRHLQAAQISNPLAATCLLPQAAPPNSLSGVMSPPSEAAPMTDRSAVAPMTSLLVSTQSQPLVVPVTQ